MKIGEARKIAGDFLDMIHYVVGKSEVCGSIRRKLPEVKDIDLVIIPNGNVDFKGFIKSRFTCNQVGDKKIALTFRGAKIDIYIADDKTFETKKLIRTGSKEHNIKLCVTAKKKKWKLYAGGRGLYNEKDELITSTERGILMTLLGRYIEPEARK